MEYKIVLDSRRALLDALPTVEANTPKEAASKYAGGPVIRHLTQRGGEIAVKRAVWPQKIYLYDRLDKGETDER